MAPHGGPTGSGADRRRESTTHRQFGDSWSGRPEIEELPAQPVVPRGSPRLGIGGTIAVLAAIALLAGGFGLLGGRPEESARPSLSAVASHPVAVASQIPPETVVPEVTPSVECGPWPTEPPEVLLEIDGTPFPGAVSLAGGSGLPPENATGEPTPHPRVEVPGDAGAELWIDNAACALAWTIELTDVAQLEHESNVLLDPQLAAQNRFRIVLSPHAGTDVELHATLVFPNFVEQVTWPLRISPYEIPVPVLSSSEGALQAQPGCDVVLELHSDYITELEPCGGALSQPPGRPLAVKPGAMLSLEFDGWDDMGGFVECGQLVPAEVTGSLFVRDQDCGIEVQPELTLSFAAPSKPGVHALAMSACAMQNGNHLCGTWYATVDVAPSES
jgi:hypothetical protein